VKQILVIGAQYGFGNFLLSLPARWGASLRARRVARTDQRRAENGPPRDWTGQSLVT